MLCKKSHPGANQQFEVSETKIWAALSLRYKSKIEPLNLHINSTTLYINIESLWLEVQ